MVLLCACVWVAHAVLGPAHIPVPQICIYCCYLKITTFSQWNVESPVKRASRMWRVSVFLHFFLRACRPYVVDFGSLLLRFVHCLTSLKPYTHLRSVRNSTTAIPHLAQWPHESLHRTENTRSTRIFVILQLTDNREKMCAYVREQCMGVYIGGGFFALSLCFFFEVQTKWVWPAEWQ